MPSQGEENRRRRNVIKGLGAAGITGLAGCTGGGEVGGQETTTTKKSSDQQDFSDVTFRYWNIINIQNRNARELSNKIIKEFEQETGATVQVNFSGYTDLVGSKWRTAWANNNYPVVYDNLTYLGGHLNHKVVPVSEYIDKFDDQTIQKYQWIMDLMAKETYRGYQGSGLDRVYEIPFGLDVREPNVFRRDHFEKAGVSWEKNMPPKNYDQLVSTMKTVMNNGPATTGYQVYGVPHDWSDVQLLPWQIANAGADGLYVDEKAREPNMDKQNWIKTFRDYVNVFRKHNLCGPQTPQMSDEKTVPNIISGRWSGGSMDPFNHPSLARQAPQLANSGKVQYTTQYKTNNLQKGGFIWSTVGLALTEKPPGVSQNKWNRKQEAAIGLMKKFLEKDLQRQSWNGFGTLPARKDVWGDLERKPHGLLDVLTTMAEETNYSVSARPGIAQIYSTLTGPTAQKALRGNISPEEACKQIAKDSRQLMKESPFPSEK
ncbi:ABC transporter substrate-binding protein [Halorussus sp. AFM4]|uniref:ABC transporter substrate-binding protein n=1 Tax=Halorussus sp. AFM4 TaxID=3421651 RepID=UPI003EB9A6E1